MVFHFKTFFYSCQLLVVNRRWDDLELCGPGFNGLLGKIDHRDTLNLMRRYNRDRLLLVLQKWKQNMKPISLLHPLLSLFLLLLPYPPALAFPFLTPILMSRFPYFLTSPPSPPLSLPSPLSPSCFCLSSPFSPLFHPLLLLPLLLPTLLLPLHLPYSSPE